MKIGNCIIEIYIPDTTSLKEKRSVLKGLKDRVRNKFNVSISEIARNNNHKISVLAVATVSNDKRHVDKILSSVINFMEKQRSFEIVNYETEIL
ncbi:DUF503 domain-containing protein [candidate division WOR-3 bacterium]|nr:DUF503 domain-containing protein [candidate division WOR-3 bacterium]MCK4575679.1 DUF503 domain-containing protein [candidate division WOR-3 bacterium]